MLETKISKEDVYSVMQALYEAITNEKEPFKAILMMNGMVRILEASAAEYDVDFYILGSTVKALLEIAIHGVNINNYYLTSKAVEKIGEEVQNFYVNNIVHDSEGDTKSEEEEEESKEDDND